MRRSCLGAGLFSIALTAIAPLACSQAYPNKVIRVYTSGAGGNSDIAARLIGASISGLLGQPLVVDNRPAGVIAPEIVSKAPPDGYSLLVTGDSFWTSALLQKTSYDVMRDFFPITLIGSSPLVLVVHPSLPVKSVKDLIALAKTHPKALNYASAGTGSSSHIGGELFKDMAGVDMVRINYKGAGAAYNDLIGGQVQLMFPAIGSVGQHIKSGRLKALAIGSAAPSALAPDLPTIKASGLPDYQSQVTTGMFAPAKTPDAIIARLYQEIVRALSTADIKEKLFNAGIEAAGGSPQEFSAYIKGDMARLSKLIKEGNMQGD